MKGMIKIRFIFIASDEAETGTAEEQPVRNNLTDWNGRGREIFPICRNEDHQKKCN
jgi:hypothetical protein